MSVQAKVKSKGSVKETVREFFDAERRNAEKVRLHAAGLTEDDDLPPYVHQHHPMALYRRNEYFGAPGVPLSEQLEEVHAVDEEQEADYREQGFTDYAKALHSELDEAPEPPAAKGRKPKQDPPKE